MFCNLPATVASFVLCLCGGVLLAEPIAPAMKVMRPGSVAPTGWLRNRAVAAKNGFTGHMEEIDEHFRLAWTTNCMRRGAQMTWMDAHNGSWSAEGGAYWFDGLVKLAFQLDDAELQALARRRLAPVLENVGPRTIGYLWWYDRTNPADVDEVFKMGVWRLWTAGIAERALSGWWEATGDPRVPRVFAYAYSFDEIACRRGGFVPSLISAAFDAHHVVALPETARFLDLCCADIARNQYAEPPWVGEEETLNLRRNSLLKLVGTGDPCGVGWPRHGVMACEYLLSALRAYQWTGNAKLLESVTAWYAFFDRHCRQPYGVTTMDEEWGWSGAKRGTETCAVAAETFMRENLLAVLGDGKWGDDVERAFFNAGPACVSRDFKRHVYYQMPNRTGQAGEAAAQSCQIDSHLQYRRSVWPLCCTAALNRILPNYVQHMWLTTADGGVAAALYGPSTVAATLPVGRVAFSEKTSYPFDEVIEIAVTDAPGMAFPVKLRIPAWCDKPEIRVNGKWVFAEVSNGFVTLDRAWKRGDVVLLRFPMVPRFEDFRDMNDFGRLRRCILLGPLLFAQAIPTRDDNTPSGKWKERMLPRDLKISDVAVARDAMPAVWNWPEVSPLRLTTKDSEACPLTLVPYGCTKLRISAFGLGER